MPHLLDCCAIDSYPASVRQLATKSGLPFPLSLRDFVAKAKCSHSKCLRLQLKLVVEPTTPDLGLTLRRARTVFNTADIGVAVVGREHLTGPQYAKFVDLDASPTAAAISAEEKELFTHRNGVAPYEIVVYYVDKYGSLYGKAPYHTGSVVIARVSDRWTLAHELGHLLGCSHDPNDHCDEMAKFPPDYTHTGRLMSPCPQLTPESMVAWVTDSEKTAMRASQFARGH